MSVCTALRGGGAHVHVGLALADQAGSGLGKTTVASQMCIILSFQIQTPAGEDRKEMTLWKWGPTDIPQLTLALTFHP